MSSGDASRTSRFVVLVPPADHYRMYEILGDVRACTSQPVHFGTPGSSSRQGPEYPEGIGQQLRRASGVEGQHESPTKPSKPPQKVIETERKEVAPSNRIGNFGQSRIDGNRSPTGVTDPERKSSPGDRDKSNARERIRSTHDRVSSEAPALPAAQVPCFQTLKFHEAFVVLENLDIPLEYEKIIIEPSNDRPEDGNDVRFFDGLPDGVRSAPSLTKCNLRSVGSASPRGNDTERSKQELPVGELLPTTLVCGQGASESRQSTKSKSAHWIWEATPPIHVSDREQSELPVGSSKEIIARISPPAIKRRRMNYSRREAVTGTCKKKWCRPPARITRAVIQVTRLKRARTKATLLRRQRARKRRIWTPPSPVNRHHYSYQTSVQWSGTVGKSTAKVEGGIDGSPANFSEYAPSLIKAKNFGGEMPPTRIGANEMPASVPIQCENKDSIHLKSCAKQSCAHEGVRKDSEARRTSGRNARRPARLTDFFIDLPAVGKGRL